MSLGFNRLSWRNANYMCRQFCLSTVSVLFRYQPTHLKAANDHPNKLSFTRTNLRKYTNSLSNQGPTLCWNCGEKSVRDNYFFCKLCGYLQDVDKNVDYFNLFSLQNKFKIDLNELSRKFRQLQTLVHPDKFGNKTEREQQNSSDWSSFINEANKTLGPPIARGQYILKTQGLEFPSDNSSLDQSFLFEMMERNEVVEDANTKNDLEKLLENTKNDIDKEIKKTEIYFDKSDFKKAIFSLVKVKYLSSLENNIKSKLEKYLQRDNNNYNKYKKAVAYNRKCGKALVFKCGKHLK